MPEVRDTVDAVLLGLFFFGLLLTIATLLLGVADLGLHHRARRRGRRQPAARQPGRRPRLPELAGRRRLRAAPVPRIAVAASPCPSPWPPVSASPRCLQKAIRKLSDPAGSVLDPEQYRLPGTLGHVSSSIRAGGTGEVVYEKGGVRQVVAARAAGTEALPRGAEVLVLRVDRGIAIVEIFDPFGALDDGVDTEALPVRSRAE